MRTTVADGLIDVRILEGIPDAVTVLDAQGRIVWANDRATRTLGPETASARDDRFEIYDESGARLPGELFPGSLALRGTPTTAAVLRVLDTETGTERWASATAWPVRDETGSVRFAVNVWRDVTERRRREDALLRRLAFQSDASDSLASSLDHATIAGTVARLAVSHLADWCIVYVVQRDGAVRRAAMEHRDPTKAGLAEVIEEEFTLNLSSAEGVPKVLRSRRSELVADATPELLSSDVYQPERLLELLRPIGISSWMCVPLVARDRTLGAISFVSTESGRHYDRTDLALAEDLARRASTAMDNARLFDERSHIARTLQRSLLPPQLPDIAGIEIAARFRPTGEGNEVGGDFYDVFETAEGDWAIVIGDVCGKGADAAALTGLSRHTIRTAAMQERRPSRVLSMLNDAIILQDTGRFCTATYARFEPAQWVAPHARITVACGGHPLPYVVRRGGPVEVVGTPGTLIGVYPDPEITDVELFLGPGDAMVFYTDGVSEEPDPSRGGETILDAVLRESIDLPAARIAERIEDAAVQRQQGSSRDDIAILVVRIEP